MATSAFTELMDVLRQGRSWKGMNDNDGARGLMERVYDERYEGHAYQKSKYQRRANLKGDESAGAYGAWITAENPTSGPFQGTCFVWFPGESGSVVCLGIGTDGFGADTHILGRPGHRRRLKALARIHGGRLWVKPDLLDVSSQIPQVVTSAWPKIPAALKAYDRVLYAAVAVTKQDDAAVVEDLLDLFFLEHETRATGKCGDRWKTRENDIAAQLFPRVPVEDVLALVRERRFVVLEGPPGTGKTRMAFEVAKRIGSSTPIQFHPARTYEDFIVGLHPRPVASGLTFDVRAGDLLQANRAAEKAEHLLIIDEINRADLSRVLGEAIVLFEVGDAQRSVRLPHTPEGFPAEFTLSDKLFVLGTRNTADRTIARIDLAVRRRFAFVEMWPDLRVVEAQNVDWATRVFHDVVMTFAEYADDDTFRLVPGHSYLLDPRPDLGDKGKERRIVDRVRRELLPLLRDYIDERLVGGASEHVLGLADRIENAVLSRRE